MKKYIRFNESELVSLVKSIIMENKEEDYSIQSDIITYQGNNKEILKFQEILKVGELSPEQLIFAKEILNKEKTTEQTSKITWDSLFNSKQIQREIINKGEELYRRIKDDDNKKNLFKTNDYEFNFPSDEWVDENIKSLNIFKKTLSPDSLSNIVELKFGDKSYKFEISKWIDGLIRALNNKSPYFTSLLKKDKEKYVWTILPKLDTNWVNWSKWIISLDSDGKLGNGTISEKINNFFEEKPIKQVVGMSDSQTIEHIKKIQEEYNLKFPKLSFAEYKWLKDALNGYKQTIQTISKSTDKGNLEEENFIGQLKIYSKFFDSEWKLYGDIISFSTPGNQVDMIFGVDMIVKFVNTNGEIKIVPVQVKSTESSAKNALIKKLGIGGISVFRDGNDWYYFDSGSRKKSFEKDFLKIQ